MTTKERVLAYYSINPWLGKMPVVGEFLECLKNTKTDPSCRIRVEHFLAPIRAIQALPNYHRNPPAKNCGGLVLNILGWQVLRTLCLCLLWKIRRLKQGSAAGISGRAREIVERMDRDGVIVLHDVFSPEEVEALKQNYQELSPRLRTYGPGHWASLVVPTEAYPPWDTPLGSEVSEKIVARNPLLSEVISFVSGYKLNLTPEVSYVEYRAQEDQGAAGQFDGQDVLHADVNYPSFKIFVYITDTDEKNGAFRYCPRSHKLSLRRLLVEYKNSIRHYRERRRGNHKPTALTQEERELLGLQEYPQEGKAGAVVIFNVMGFHRRGDFTDPASPLRQLMMTNYRYLDTWANTFSLPLKSLVKTAERKSAC